MSYDAKVLSINPLLYIPMDDRQERIPVDVIGSAQVAFVGEKPRFVDKNLFLTDFCVLNENSSLLVSASSLFPYGTSYTYGLWFRTSSEEADIFDSRDSESGFGVAVRPGGELKFYFNGNQNEVVSSVDPDKTHFACIVYDGNIRFYFDGEEVGTYSHTPPGINTLTLGGKSSGSKVGICEVSGLFGLDYPIDSQTVKDLYTSGKVGATLRRVSADSAIGVSDNRADSFQTSWQAYGIVVYKE